MHDVIVRFSGNVLKTGSVMVVASLPHIITGGVTGTTAVTASAVAGPLVILGGVVVAGYLYFKKP